MARSSSDASAAAGRVNAPGAPSGRSAPEEPPAHRWWVLGVVGIAQLMVILDATIVTIALPSAQKDLGFSDGDRQWVVTAYALAFGSLLLFGGRLADLFGRKRIFLIGLVGFAAASAMGGAATSFEILVVARALQGAFGAVLAPAALSLLTTTFTDAKERAKAFGIYGAIAGAGAAVGLLLGGLLTEYLDWRWCLYVNLIFAVIAFIGGARLLSPGVLPGRPTLDLPGTLLVSSGLFCIVYGFSNAERHPWGAASTWAFLLAGVILLAGFVWWQQRARHPLLPMRVVRDRDRGASFIAMFLSGAGMFGVFLFLTYYMQRTLLYSPVKTGLAFLPMVALLVVTSLTTTNVLVPKYGAKPIVPTGMLLAAGAMAWMTALDANSTYAAHILPPLLLLGIALGLIFATAMNLATAGVKVNDAGVASAMVNTTQQVGGSVGTSLLNTLATSAAAHYLSGRRPTPAAVGQAQLHSYAVAYWWSAGFFAFGFLVTFLLFRPGPPRIAKTAPEESPAPVSTSRKPAP